MIASWDTFVCATSASLDVTQMMTAVPRNHAGTTVVITLAKITHVVRMRFVLFLITAHPALASPEWSLVQQLRSVVLDRRPYHVLKTDSVQRVSRASLKCAGLFVPTMPAV